LSTAYVACARLQGTNLERPVLGSSRARFKRDVAGLQVTVDDTDAMRGIERARI
jgi:hypothetical protein